MSGPGRNREAADSGAERAVRIAAEHAAGAPSNERIDAQRAAAGALAGDTITALATPQGRAALAMVRLSGPRAFEIAARCVTPWPIAWRRATLVSIRGQSNTVVDQAIAVAYPAPHSYTGEDVVELSCHGGASAPALVTSALVRAGARPALAGEFTRRAVLNGKMDLLQAEATADLIDAPGGLLHRAAIAQLSGSFTVRTNALRGALLDLEALLAYDVDFPDEDDGPIARATIADAGRAVQRDLQAMLDTIPAARLAREGATVVLAGVPNAGKSSLFNALVGEERVLVTAEPGTTRDAVDSLIDVDPYPLRLVDTAGVRDTEHPIERMGVEVSYRWLARADLVLLCGSTRAERDRAEAAVASAGGRASVAGFDSLIRVHTMLDRSPADDGADVAVSAVTGEGLAALRAVISERLIARHPVPPPDVPLVLRARQEHALTHAMQELDEFLAAWNDGRVPATIAAVHVRSAVHTLEDLIGGVQVDDVLDRVFERFCVGK
jgi:tRNA modification GTPase